ncbi:MAG: hypothetical protein Q4G24_06770 [Paracoccus sp. (in: a-proteobacteria)]|uniref:hypothetical protein n=1 Tax=Paracoccus sp. TaxID=267 RepID=UPI0026DF90E1|nr:hypothetical protein [Paracoccus sp. (in: a-proteobacteria)]MDO5621155.1 hypothetical protein [Paracoccus sp. (in: a-proteobacteria)]
MSDLALILGTALCALSVPVAVISALLLRPPRAAAVMMILGLAGLGAGAWLAKTPTAALDLPAAWARLIAGTPE